MAQYDPSELGFIDETSKDEQTRHLVGIMDGRRKVDVWRKIALSMFTASFSLFEYCGGWGRYLRWLSEFIVVVKFDSFVVVVLCFMILSIFFHLNIILGTGIEVTVMIEQACVFLIDMRSYLWHGNIG